jgi:4-aminobutyrate aminotransferase
MDPHTKPRIIVEPPGPKAMEIIKRDQELSSPSLTRTAPLVGVRSEGVWVEDIDGNVYLDFGSGIAVVNVGHSHKKVVEAIKRQAETCDHINSCDYFTVPQVEYAERLLARLPGNFPKRVFFGNSGAEAVECAIKIAKWHSGGKPYLIGFIGGFHGRTMGALSLTSTTISARRFFFPMMPGVMHVPYAYCYRCLYKQSYPDCGMWCVGYIEDVVFKKLISPDEVAGLIVEPIQGAGGYIVPPKEFLPSLRKICDTHGIAMIADEVQSGFGRTGKMICCEHWNVIPDIIVMSKAIAGGLPMGACISKADLMDWGPTAHENTLGGNPIVVAAALAVLDVLIEERLIENAEKVGAYMLKRFNEIMNECNLVGDVRGKGMMVGIELVKDRETKEYATKERDDLILRTFKKGLLILGAGPSSIRLAPPLITTIEQAEIGIKIFEEELRAVSK